MDRSHDGKIAQEITFAPDGAFQSGNPVTNAAKEAGKYSIATDGKTINFNTGAVSYSWQIDFKSKDEFNCVEQLGKSSRMEFTYHRKK